MIRTIATAWMLLKDQRNGSTESLARSIGLVHGRIPWPEYFTLFLGFPYWFGKRETRRSREELARSRRHIERHAPRMIKPGDRKLLGTDLAKPSDHGLEPIEGGIPAFTEPKPMNVHGQMASTGQ
jgi:hypothetical protein